MEKTAEYLNAKGWTEVKYRQIPPEYKPLIMWRHPVKNWTVSFDTACELQLGIELKERRANGKG